MHALTSFKREENTLTKNRDAMEPIKLRNLNLVTKHQLGPFVKDGPAAKNLIDPLRKPEPAVIKSRRSHRLSIGYSSLGDLTDVKEEFNAPSPSLGHTLVLCRDKLSEGSRPIQLCDGAILDVSGERTFDVRGFDCQPFFHCYNYESRFEKDDCESIINKLVTDEMNNRQPVFQKELEFLEIKKMIRRTDYLMFYLLGIDRLGYFRLKQERDSFRNSLSEAYTSSLRYKDNESSESESRTGDEESNSSFHTDDAPDDRLSNPSV
ncbi:hypothetical protein HG536_0C02020 [Torulaspora globosa]|uniref:Uncharacterized protein n=1 Tax=Torulaspora globosa TaxID=48254 RepID=A0A7G3ZEU8_9SACH|nr:uncharacterized protein HG536_0C02020 [Torulaspora globosa]QLL32034.1 hypothetical protein HG536_0C02020 [Torulaspora globosa]